jgi:nucleotide-binding universal stress UspA family protein
MFDNVMIGIDGHQGARDAIALAQQLVSDSGTLTLAYVHEGLPAPARGATSGFVPSARERADALLAELGSKAGVEAKLRTVGSPSVGRGLHELAESDGADLLVVGSTRHGLLGRVLIGDDTRHALNGAPCAVAIAPAGYAARATALTEIGVAYNESAESRHALEVGRGLAAERGAKLSAFEAVSLPSYMLIGGLVAVDAATESYVEDARKRIAEFGHVEAQVEYGNTVEELTVYSASLDLLVVGSRGYGPFGRVVHGSTSQALTRTARCPLLVLTRAARAADAEEITDPAVAINA